MNEKKEKCFCYFVDLKRQSLFAYIPEWDQNHVVRGKKPGDLFWLILKFEKSF